MNEALLAEALLGLIKLIDDGDLVRDTRHDHDWNVYVQQSMRIIKVLEAAKTALNYENTQPQPAVR